MHLTAQQLDRERPNPRWMVACLIVGLGIILGGMSWLDLYPVRTIAAWGSSDGILSAPYLSLIRCSQERLALSLVLAGALFGWIDARRVLDYVRSLPFWTVALITGSAAGLLTYAVQEWLFDGIPHITDATSHLFQAKIFALGRMYAPAPECPDAFWQPNVLITYSGKWFSKYTPGHALLLAAGMKVGLVKWVLPSCVFTIIVSLGRLLERYEGRLFAYVSMFFLSSSPLLLLLGGSYMSHVSAMAFMALGLLFWIHAHERSSVSSSRACTVIAGLFLAASAITRPHEFVLIGFIGFLYSLSFQREHWKKMFAGVPWIVLGMLPVLAFWMVWNHALYADPFAVGYGFTKGDTLRPAFQGDLGFSSDFGVREAFHLLVWNLDKVNGSLYGWPLSLFFVPVAFIRSGGRLLYLSILGCAVGIGFYFFYNYHSELESRYYFLILPFMIYLTVRGIRNLIVFRSSVRWQAGVAQGIFLLSGAFYLYAMLFYWPVYIIPKYNQGYEDSSPVVEQAVKRAGLTHAVVLIGPDDGSSFFYSSGFIYTDPLLRQEVIYARGIPQAVECIRHAFPSRQLYQFIQRPGEEEGQLSCLKISPPG